MTVMSPPAASTASQTPSPTVLKITHAAQQFEMFLLSTLLGPVESSFASVPGAPKQPGADELQYLGTQALASGLVAVGGLGIADRIVRSLLKTKMIESSSAAPRG